MESKSLLTSVASWPSVSYRPLLDAIAILVDDMLNTVNPDEVFSMWYLAKYSENRFGLVEAESGITTHQYVLVFASAMTKKAPVSGLRCSNLTLHGNSSQSDIRHLAQWGPHREFSSAIRQTGCGVQLWLSKSHRYIRLQKERLAQKLVQLDLSNGESKPIHKVLRCRPVEVVHH